MPKLTKSKPVTKNVEKPKKTKKVSIDVPVVEKGDKSLPHDKKVRIHIQSVDMKGNKGDLMTLPEEMFGVAYNPTLVSQYVRVYLANQREGGASTKTRGLVEGSTRKLYKQKGTGKARHGSIRSPIYVGGGIVFGPVTRDFCLKLTKKMKQKACFSVLSEVIRSKRCMVCDMKTIEPKTKVFANLLKNLEVKTPVLIVTGDQTRHVVKAARNIDRVTTIPFQSINPYLLLTHKTIVFAQDALVGYIERNKKA